MSIDKVSAPQRFAWVVGDFDASYGMASDAAERLLQHTKDDSKNLSYISGQNGYYLAVLFYDEPRLAIGTDPLGLFPLYYWTTRYICIFGTSPELFRLHPSYAARPSLYGIASVLLITHISDGRSIFDGVHRADLGHYVQWTPDDGVREISAHPIRMSDTSFNVPYEACLERVSFCLDRFHICLRVRYVLSVSVNAAIRS
jgi:asparagine synthase (glutamine-hydrolysing)